MSPSQEQNSRTGVNLNSARDLKEATIAGKNVIQTYYIGPNPEQWADLQRQMEGLRQQQLEEGRQRQNRKRKWIGPRPAEEIACFVDREAYLHRVNEDVTNPDIRVILIVGQGGIGKTALAAKFCTEIEQAGYHFPPAFSSESHDEEIRAIVFVSRNDMAAFTIDHIFEKLLQTFDQETIARLKPLVDNPHANIALKTEAFLNELQEDTTLLVLDNFETLLSKTAIRDADLKTFLTLVCQNRHALKVLITSRIDVQMNVFSGIQDEPVFISEGLADEHAVELLRRFGRMGRKIPQLLKADDSSLRALAQKVYGIPMALKALAAFLRHNRRLTLKSLIEDESRFANFRQYDVKEGLTKLIAQQYDLLPEPARRALQALALFNMPVPATAVQYVFPDIEADAVLDSLAWEYYLIQANVEEDCFEMHPVVQEYAYRQIPVSRAALPSSSLMLHENTGQRASEPEAGAQDVKTDLHVRAAKFYAELKKPEHEWRGIEDVQPHLREIQQRIYAGHYDHAAHVLDEIDGEYLQKWGHSRLVMRVREQLQGHLHDDSLIGVNTHNLGVVYLDTGRVKEAIPLFEDALASARKNKDREGEGACIGNLGRAYAAMGSLRRAIDCYTGAFEIAQEIDDHFGELCHTGNVGNVYLMTGQVQSAFEAYSHALELVKELGEQREEGHCLCALGTVYALLGQRDKAMAYYNRALDIAREIGDRVGEGIVLSNLGQLHIVLEQPRRGLEYCTHALEIRRETGDRRGESIDLDNSGYAYLDRCLQENADTWLSQAIECHEHALEILHKIDAPDVWCMTLKNVGVACLFASDDARASAYCKQCFNACEQTLSRSRMYSVLYHKAVSLLGHAIAGHDTEHPETNPLEKAYQDALSVCSEAGVVQQAIQEFERLRCICTRRQCAFPASGQVIRSLLQASLE